LFLFFSPIKRKIMTQLLINSVLGALGGFGAGAAGKGTSNPLVNAAIGLIGGSAAPWIMTALNLFGGTDMLANAATSLLGGAAGTLLGGILGKKA
jgi:ammonia channel protein AmtB